MKKKSMLSLFLVLWMCGCLPWNLIAQVPQSCCTQGLPIFSENFEDISTINFNTDLNGPRPGNDLGSNGFTLTNVDAGTFNQNWEGSAQSGSGYMLIDGPIMSQGDKLVWGTSIQNVSACHSYCFCIWIKNIGINSSTTSIPELQLRLNQGGTVSNLSNWTSVTYENGWIQLCGQFSLGNTFAPIELQVFSRAVSTSNDGNDFAIDNITLIDCGAQAPGGLAYAPQYQKVCQGESLVLSAYPPDPPQGGMYCNWTWRDEQNNMVSIGPNFTTSGFLAPGVYSYFLVAEDCLNCSQDYYTFIIEVIECPENCCTGSSQRTTVLKETFNDLNQNFTTDLQPGLLDPVTWNGEFILSDQDASELNPAWEGNPFSAPGYMVIDGPTLFDGDAKVWGKAPPTLETGREYCFCVWVKNLCPECGNIPEVKLQIQTSGGPIVIRDFTEVQAIDGWTRICGSFFYDGSFTIDELQIISLGTGGVAGNDFAIDDITLVACDYNWFLSGEGSSDQLGSVEDKTSDNNAGNRTKQNQSLFSKEFTLYPNPTPSHVTIQFRLEKAAEIKIAILSVSGQVLKTVEQESFSPGTYKHKLDLTGLPNGIYWCKLTADDSIQTERLVIFR